MGSLRRLYDRRIINVNVNVILAGIVALVFTVAVMHTAERLGLLPKLSAKIPTFSRSMFGRVYTFEGHKFAVSGITFLVDLIADVAAYYGLHWVANHMPRKREVRKPAGYADLTFMRDATLVQFERALLSPVLYVIALGLQNMLLHQGMGIAASTAWGFGVGIACTRALHTLWMLRQERQAGRSSAADIVGPDPQEH